MLADPAGCLRAAGALVATLCWETDEALRIGAAQGTALAAIGVSEDALVGLDLPTALIADSEGAKLLAAHRRALEGEVVELEVEHASRVYSVRCSPREAAKGVTGCAVDVTERRRFAQSLSLLQLVSAALGEVGHMIEASNAVLEAIGRTLRFECVELWVEHERGVKRVKRWASPCWSEACLAAEANRVTETRTSEWITGADRTTCTVPYASNGALHGVVVCASKRSSPEDRAIIAMLENLGSLIGQCLVKVRDADHDGVRAEQRFRALIDNSLDAVAVVSACGRLLYVSPARDRILGKRSEADGASSYARIHPDDAEGARAMILELAQRPRGTARTTLRVKHEDGTYRWIEGLASNRLDDPTVAGIVINYRDVTQQKLAEDALVEANTVLEKRVAERTAELRAALAEVQDLYDNALCGYHALDREGRYVRVNRRELAWLGYSEAEVIGRPFVDFVAPESRGELERGFAMLHERGMVEGVELVLVRKDQSRLIALCSVTEVQDDLHGPISCRATFLDITERRRIENQARVLLAGQAHATRLSTLGAMASGLAHELNQPLTAISVYARASSRRVGAEQIDIVELQDSLEKITRQAERAGEVIRRLRAFVSNWEPCRTNVDVNELIREAVAMFEVELRSSGTRLQLQLGAGLPRVEVDRLQIEQVMLNLLRNGIEAMAEVTGRERMLRIVSRSTARGVEVSIADAGTGIAPEIAARLFHPFQTTRRGGLGLGLAVSRSIVDAHGGDLRAEKSTSDGTSFVIALPAHGLR